MESGLLGCWLMKELKSSASVSLQKSESNDMGISSK